MFRKELVGQIEKGFAPYNTTNENTWAQIAGKSLSFIWSPLSEGWCYDMAGPERKGACQCEEPKLL